MKQKINNNYFLEISPEGYIKLYYLGSEIGKTKSTLNLKINQFEEFGDYIIKFNTQIYDSSNLSMDIYIVCIANTIHEYDFNPEILYENYNGILYVIVGTEYYIYDIETDNLCQIPFELSRYDKKELSGICKSILKLLNA